MHALVDRGVKLFEPAAEKRHAFFVAVDLRRIGVARLADTVGLDPHDVAIDAAALTLEVVDQAARERDGCSGAARCDVLRFTFAIALLRLLRKRATSPTTESRKKLAAKSCQPISAFTSSEISAAQRDEDRGEADEKVQPHGPKTGRGATRL